VTLHFSDQFQLIARIQDPGRVGGPGPTGRSALARPQGTVVNL